MPDRCERCGSPDVAERIEPFVVERDGRSRTIEDRRTVCGACGTVSYRGDQVSAHELAVAAAIRDMEGLLSAEELRAVRLKYGFLQTDMERMLSTGPKTWTRWERGKVPQSKPADKLIRLMAGDPAVARRLMLDAGVGNPEAEAVFAEIDRRAVMRTQAMLRAELDRHGAPDADRVAGLVAQALAESDRREAAAA